MPFASMFAAAAVPVTVRSPQGKRVVPAAPERALTAERWPSMLGQLIDTDVPGGHSARLALERDSVANSSQWDAVDERPPDEEDANDEGAADDSGRGLYPTASPRQFGAAGSDDDGDRDPAAYSRETEAAPIADMTLALNDVFQELGADETAQTLRLLLCREQCALLTEPEARTAQRRVLHAFASNVHAHMGTSATLHEWRTQLVGPWAGADAVRGAGPELDELQRTLATLLSDESREYDALVDVYHADDALFVTCVYTRERDPRSGAVAAGAQYCFEGYLFTQSSQSHCADVARADAGLR